MIGSTEEKKGGWFSKADRSPRNVLRSPTTPSDMSVTCVTYILVHVLICTTFRALNKKFDTYIPQWAAYFDQGGVIGLRNERRTGRRNQGDAVAIIIVTIMFVYKHLLQTWEQRERRR